MNKNKQSIFPALIPMRKRGLLKCPDCAERMVPFSCDRAVVDKCDKCNGIWFDRGEFGVFKKSLDKFDLSGVEVNFTEPVDSALSISSCSRCVDEVLVDAPYSYKSGVAVKRCNKCEGIWLPIKQALNLVELTKLGQLLLEDAKGLAKGVKENNQEREKLKKIARLGDQLNRPVHYPATFWAIAFLPLYDDNPRKITPYVTIGIIVLNIFTYLKMPTYAGELEEFYKSYALQPAEILRLESLKTLFSSVFLHGGVMHLLGNMFYLWLFGDNIEEKFGTKNFIIFYLFCGLAASFGHILSDPSSMVPCLGASGAISGVMGAYMVFFPHANIKTLTVGRIIDVPVWIYLGIWILMQVFYGFLNLSLDINTGTAWWAHIGGFVAGLLVAVLYKNSGQRRRVSRPL